MLCRKYAKPWAEALERRLGCVWARLRSLQQALVGKHVETKLRLQLPDIVGTPAIVYALGKCPLIKLQLERLHITQRRMLRQMVGWACYDDESSEERGRRMKKRIESALELHLVMDWSKRLAIRTVKMIRFIEAAPRMDKTSM